jgi:GTP-binding protein
MLCNHKNLAKTSATPGKTLLINHFLIESKPSTNAQRPTPNGQQWYIIDLPGYGFAKRSKKVQDDIETMISTYILQREQLVNVFLLIDIRHDPQKIDREFMDWLGENGVPFSIVFTKADKLTPNKANQAVEAYKKKLLETWEVLPPTFLTSSEKKEGRDEILQYIDDINKELKG